MFKKIFTLIVAGAALFIVLLFLSCDQNEPIRYEGGANCRFEIQTGATAVNWPAQFEAVITVEPYERDAFNASVWEVTVNQDSQDSTKYRVNQVIELPLEIPALVSMTAEIEGITWATDPDNPLYVDLESEEAQIYTLILSEQLSGNILMIENFNTDIQGVPAGWSFDGDTTNYDIFVQNGELHITQLTTASFGMVFYDSVFTGDYSVTYDMTVSNNTEFYYYGYGVVNFTSSAADDGYYAHLELEDFNQIFSLSRGFYNFVDNYQSTLFKDIVYEVEIINNGGQVEASLDGQALLNYDDLTPYSDGTVGFGCYGCEVIIDNVLVEAVTGGPVPPNNEPLIPSNPFPTDGALGVDTLAVQLQWTCIDPDGDPLTYTIDWDNNPLMQNQATTNQNFYELFNLQAGGRYYWRITADDGNGGVTVGPVWTFFCSGSPNNPPDQPSNPSPPNGETDVYPAFVELFWTCDDIDGDTLTYTIYGGDTFPLPELSAGLIDPMYFWDNLNETTVYFWYVEADDGNGGVTIGPTWEFTTGPY